MKLVIIITIIDIKATKWCAPKHVNLDESAKESKDKSAIQRIHSHHYF